MWQPLPWTTASFPVLNYYIHAARLHSELDKIIFAEENKIWSPCMEYHQSNPWAVRVYQQWQDIHIQTGCFLWLQIFLKSRNIFCSAFLILFFDFNLYPFDFYIPLNLLAKQFAEEKYWWGKKMAWYLSESLLLNWPGDMYPKDSTGLGMLQPGGCCLL